MKKNKYFFYIMLFCSIATTSLAQQAAPAVLWQKTVGGTGNDVLTAMCAGADKSVVLCGYSKSEASGNKTNGSFGGYDYWVVKLNSNGEVMWNHTYGGADDDKAAAIIPTSDGGYLLGGTSLSGISGTKTAAAFEYSPDYWVLKLNAVGNVEWDRTLGGTYRDELTSLAEMPNGTFAVGGYSYSNKSGTKTTDNRGSWTNADYWTVILHKDGTEKSQHLFGGVGHDVLNGILPTASNGFYAGGYSYSAKGKGKTLRPYGNNDFYLIRSNAKGGVELEAEFGGTLSDYQTKMILMPDDSTIILAGYSNSDKGKTKGDKFYGVYDYWMVKIKPNGTKVWDKTISGAAGYGVGGDYLISVQATKDKGFILGGYSNSPVGRDKTEGSQGGFDYWIVKTDSLGNVQWNKTFGGSADDKLTAICELDNNEYVIAGTSASGISGDKTDGVVGNGTETDYWVLRLGTQQPLAEASVARKIAPTAATDSRYKLAILPNPVKDVLTIQYTAVAAGKADLAVYGANGQQVLQTTFGAGTSGIQTFNIASLPGGAYFAVMSVNGVKISRAFTKE